VIQAAIVIVIVALISGVGFVAGKKFERVIWQQTYNTLSAQMTKLQSDLNLKNTEVKLSADTELAEITVYGKVLDTENEYIQKEIDRRVELYLTKLSRSGLQFSTKERDSSKGSDSGSLPLSTSVLNIRDNESKLIRSLDKLERGIVQGLIRSRDKAVARNIQCKSYLEEVEGRMDLLRDK
jgi:hypothetical protein